MPEPVRTLHRERVRSIADIRAMEKYSYSELRPADTIHGCLAAIAAECPDKSAVIVVEEPNVRKPARVVTFRQFVDGIEEAACLFHDKAGPDGSVVAVMLSMVPESLIAMWGAATAGVAVPLNPFLECGALVSALKQTKAAVLVTSRDILEKKCEGGAELLREQVPGLGQVFYVDDPDPSMDLASAMAAYTGRGLDFEVNEDAWRDAVIQPTGGTTGSPKLVRMSQAGQLSVGSNVGALMGNEADGVVGHGMPNFHCGGSLSISLRALMHGMTVLTLTTEGFRSRWAIENFWQIADHYKMTSLLATPTTALALLDGPGAPAPGHLLQDFHCGGSTLPVDLVKDFHDRFGIWLRENWGMTEVHGTVTGHPNDATAPRPGSAGVPLPRTPIRAVVLDGDNNFVRDCAPNERGSLVIGGDTVTAGYVDQTQNAGFHVGGMPGPGRWANTGDIGALDEDGYVYVFGRAKDLIIRGGHNIDPREIEDALSQHPAVHIAAAVGRPDKAKGELPIAYVQLLDGEWATAAELKAFCREKVQERAAAPVDVVIVEQMPLTPVGKISKPVLRQLALESEMRAAVASSASTAVDVDVDIDEKGPRRRVLVTLHPASADLDLHAVRARLGGYEFETTVELAGGLQAV
ncbi:MAG TPA: AMP-binding protein [Jatrophihabitans sp.]